MNSPSRCKEGLCGLLVACLATASYAGSNEEDWRAVAEKRISEHRQADAQVSVVNAEGKPVSGAVVRIEQLHPFPGVLLGLLVDSYPNLKEVVWSQEEPRNMGALSFLGPRLRSVIPRKIPLRYVARPERASPAEGKASDHVAEQKRLVEESLLPVPADE